ncbi:asparagine synthase (glutamine-hydrolyzing) [Pseudophaeobacter arcticus]|uniref:asparagine synthase (glutamine-hydrolyzing) n=2 Tax=Pseudophaeobacter arcticus TaxID=385492 RepID=UPI0003F83A8D|nr:asparagine synthase (glutamine-hydrolyzing) [Pseudophaeobacter arcticus]
MCGICGAFSASGPPPAAPQVVAQMQAQLVHRGPDDDGMFLDDRVGLGFRRLAIVDLEGGNQPISNEDGSLWLICNGEIFNAPSLRKRLIRQGHHFATGSDVEVILHLYEDHGEALLEQLNGQFAFALYDSGKKRLFCARDPFGVAPFFYTHVDSALVFASEIKAILTYPGVAREVDLTGLDQILSLPGLVSPRTMFKGIHSLPPGHKLVADGAGTRSSAYWDLDYPTSAAPPHSGENFSAAVCEALASSVERRLMADVPVGSYLSGGLDSAFITALMADNSVKPLNSFSVCFDQAMFDEDKYQSLVADRTGSRHRSTLHPAAHISAALRHSIWHAECPIKESYNTASLTLSAATRDAGVPVVLSGEGADELFAGYLGYRYDAFRALRGQAAPCPAEAALRARAFGAADVFYEKDLLSHEAQRRNLYAAPLAGDLQQFCFSNTPLVDESKIRGRHVIHQRSYLDFKLRLGDHLLGDHGDRMLMANSVEGRFPFLDRDLVQLVTRIPPDQLLHGFEEKHVLKQAAKHHVPAEIIAREKFAFAAPGSAFLLLQDCPWIADLLSPATIRAQGYFDVAAVEALKHAALSEPALPSGGAPDDALLTVLSFGIFLECFDMPLLGPGGT